MGRPTSRSEMTRVTELKDRSIKMIKSEHQREKWLKQEKKNLKDLWGTGSTPTLCNLSPRLKGEREWCRKKSTQRNTSPKLPKSGEKHQHVTPRSSLNAKQGKHLLCKDEEKNLKSSQRKEGCYKYSTVWMTADFSRRRQDEILKRCQKKTKTNQSIHKSISSKTISEKWRQNKGIFG